MQSCLEFGTIIIDSDEKFKEFQSKYKIYCPIDRFCTLMYSKYRISVLDRRDSKDAEYSEMDAQHDFDFKNEDRTLDYEFE